MSGEDEGICNIYNLKFYFVIFFLAILFPALTILMHHSLRTMLGSGESLKPGGGGGSQILQWLNSYLYIGLACNFIESKKKKLKQNTCSTQDLIKAEFLRLDLYISNKVKVLVT